MIVQHEDELRTPPKASTLLRVLSALPFGIAWASFPDGKIQYCNAEFVRLFGHDASQFRTVDQFVDSLYLHERQREMVRKRWLDIELHHSAHPVATGDMEIDVVTSEGSIRTVLHSGLILHDEKLAVAIFKDFSGLQSNRRQLLELIYRDDLTGVSNRRGLRERWHAEVSEDPQRRLAFLMLDLDDFKPINDSYGHAVGDTVLQIIAERLKAAVRETDLVCRLGGDEFGILLVAPSDLSHIEMVCSRILESVNTPLLVDNLKLSVGVSIGACLYPDQAADKHELLRRADRALYQIKRTGEKVPGAGSKESIQSKAWLFLEINAVVIRSG